MHSEFHRNTRIVAPVPLVWQEMDSLEAILAKSPHFLTYQLSGEGERALVTAELSWGPLKCGVEGTAEIRSPQPQQQTGYVVSVPSLGLRYTATIRIAPSSPTETTLDYSADLEIGNRMAERMRGLFNELIEDHIQGLTTRVKTRAEHRRQADERLFYL